MNTPNTTETTAERSDMEAQVLQQLRHEIQETIRLYAPAQWSDMQCEEVEKRIMDHSKAVLGALTTQELASSFALDRHIDAAIAETKILLHGWRS
jgi:BioD-like phosphotransacetylase family protein